MSGSETDVKSEWVGRVLGVQVPGPSGSQDSPGAFDWPSIRSDFEAASDAVDKQIAALQSASANRPRSPPDSTPTGVRACSGVNRKSFM